MTEVVILGSGAAEPQLNRANACYFVRTDIPLLLDFGPGALLNMLRAGIDRNCLEHLFWTHLHADHISEFIPFFFHSVCYSKEHSRGDLTIYGPEGTQRLVQSILPVFPAFDKARFKVHIKEFRAQAIEDQTVKLGRTLIRAYPVRHSAGLVALGYRIEYEGRTIVYSGDASFSPELIDLCRGADLAILEATRPAECPVRGHMTAQEACEAAGAAGVKQLVLTHFDPIWKEYDLKAQCEGRFKGEIMAAEDLMRVRV